MHNEMLTKGCVCLFLFNFNFSPPFFLCMCVCSCISKRASLWARCLLSWQHHLNHPFLKLCGLLYQLQVLYMWDTFSAFCYSELELRESHIYLHNCLTFSFNYCN